MKDKLFKFLFPKKYELIDDLLKRTTFSEPIIESMKAAMNSVAIEKNKKIAELEKELLTQKLEEHSKYLFKFELNNTDDEGRPVHYLSKLGPAERANYVAELESMWANPKLHDILEYVINLFGNKGMQVLPEEHMRDARYAILGVKQVVTEFENAHREFQNTKDLEDNKFDPLEPLPE